MTYIGIAAFDGCSSLSSIVIPNNVANIGKQAFHSCSNLSSITVPNSVFSIGEWAFWGCDNVTELTIPYFHDNFNPLLSSNLRKLTLGDFCRETPSGSLKDCTNLQELTLPFLSIHLDELFEGLTPQTLEKLTITRPTDSLPDDILSECHMIKVLDISNSIQELGENALYGCSGLTDIYSRRIYPPAAYTESTFMGVNKAACTIHVPAGSKQFYEQAAGWNEFANIQEESPLLISAFPIPLFGGNVYGLWGYNYGEEAYLEAIANPDYEFCGWLENEIIFSSNRGIAFTITDARTLYAIFTPKENADENIQIQADAQSAIITWIAVEDADNYTLVIYSDNSRTQEVSRFELDVNGNIVRALTENLSCIVPDLESNRFYYYSLSSYNRESIMLTLSYGDFSTSTVGLETTDYTNENHIYPNPANDIFFVSGICGNANLSIMDLSGKTVLTCLVGNDETVSVAHLSDGMYIVLVRDENGETKQKLIVKH